MKGNPNPSPETRFQPGQVANPGGITSEQRRNALRAAELATQIRLAHLEAQAAEIAAGELPGVNSDNLRLWKDAEDRGLGAPTQTVDNTHDISARLNEEVRDFNSKLARVASRSRKAGDPS